MGGEGVEGVEGTTTGANMTNENTLTDLAARQERNTALMMGISELREERELVMAVVSMRNDGSRNVAQAGG